MKQTVKMAKVITMKVELNSKYFMKIVTTVDPIVTPEMAFCMYGVGGKIVSVETTNVMPLPLALFESRRQLEKSATI